MLIIKKDFNFSVFEACLKQAKAESKLRLPSQLNHVGVWGNEIALIQLLITWSRSHSRPELKTYINQEDHSGRDIQLTDLGHRLFGISALYLSHSIVTAQGTEIEREEYARYCNDALKSMNECDIYSSISVNKTYPRTLDKVAAQFICLHRSKYEYLNSLYHEPSRSALIGRSGFHALFDSALANKPIFSEYIGQLPSFSDALASLLYELFQNTNDHAYEMPDRKTSYPKNIRAFTIKSHSEWIEGLGPTRMQSDNERFNQYLSFCTDLFKNKKFKSRNFLEISVVDGGAGFAQRFAQTPINNISLKEEIKITVDCFREGVTSKGPKSRGDGLDQVWQHLCQLKGFIRLRTGRTCLYQVFHDKKTSDARSFSNWSKEELAHAEGTAITIIIPCVF